MSHSQALKFYANPALAKAAMEADPSAAERLAEAVIRDTPWANHDWVKDFLPVD